MIGSFAGLAIKSLSSASKAKWFGQAAFNNSATGQDTDFMKHDYSTMTFSADAEINKVILHNRDYHTLCVIQDASGYSSAEGLAQWVRTGKAFAIEPKWPCCRGEAWYRAQAERDIDQEGAMACLDGQEI